MVGLPKAVVVADGDCSQARLESFFRPMSRIVSRKRQSGAHRVGRGDSKGWPTAARGDVPSPKDSLRRRSCGNKETGTAADLQGLTVKPDWVEDQAGIQDATNTRRIENERKRADPEGFFNTATMERPPEELTYKKRVRLTENRYGRVHLLLFDEEVWCEPRKENPRRRALIVELVHVVLERYPLCYAPYYAP